jgi:hypothetical protein
LFFTALDDLPDASNELLDLVSGKSCSRLVTQRLHLWISQLERSLPNPHIGNLIFYPDKGDKNLTAERIVDKAMRYHPIEP